jgi:hypothetical protein
VQCYLGPTSCASAMAHESSMAAALSPVVAAKEVPHATRSTAGTQKWAMGEGSLPLLRATSRAVLACRETATRQCR